MTRDDHLIHEIVRVSNTTLDTAMACDLFSWHPREAFVKTRTSTTCLVCLCVKTEWVMNPYINEGPSFTFFRGRRR
jgi:hypothetical protein